MTKAQTGRLKSRGGPRIDASVIGEFRSPPGDGDTSVAERDVFPCT
jgi:hypothetical protein